MMDYEKLIDDLRDLLDQYGEKIPYGELVCAEGGYGRAGDLVWTDPEPYYIEQSADAISALLAENARLRKERDAAVDCIYKIEDDLDRGTDNDWAREHISEWESQKED